MVIEVRRPARDEVEQVCRLSAEVEPALPESPAWWREAAEGKTVGLVAVIRGVAGYGAIRPEPGFPPGSGCCRLTLYVSPAHRRLGIGGLLLTRLLDESRGCRDLRARVNHTDQEALNFLTKQGFSEFQRMLFLVQELDPPPQWQARPLPADLSTTTMALEMEQRPECMCEICELHNASVSDIPSGDPFVPLTEESFARMVSDPLVLDDCFFLVRSGERYVGFSYAGRQPGQPEALRLRTTGVLPEFRRRGIATVLKQEVTRYATSHGYRRVITSTLRANLGMRAVNETLGFRFSHAEVRLRRLVGEAEPYLRDLHGNS